MLVSVVVVDVVLNGRRCYSEITRKISLSHFVFHSYQLFLDSGHSKNQLGYITLMAVAVWLRRYRDNIVELR